MEGSVVENLRSVKKCCACFHAGGKGTVGRYRGLKIKLLLCARYV